VFLDQLHGLVRREGLRVVDLFVSPPLINGGRLSAIWAVVHDRGLDLAVVIDRIRVPFENTLASGTLAPEIAIFVEWQFKWNLKFVVHVDPYPKIDSCFVIS